MLFTKKSNLAPYCPQNNSDRLATLSKSPRSENMYYSQTASCSWGNKPLLQTKEMKQHIRMVKHLSEGRGKQCKCHSCRKATGRPENTGTGMRKLQSTALRTAPGGLGLRHDEDSRSRHWPVYLKALKLLPHYFLPATGTIQCKREAAKETFYLYDFFLDALENKCYTERRFLTHPAVKKIKPWGWKAGGFM